MTVRELIIELLHADQNAQVKIAYRNQSNAVFDEQEDIIKAVRILDESDRDTNAVYLCSRDRKHDFKPL